MDLRDELVAIAQSVCESLGVEFYWLDYQPSSRRGRVRVYIDKAGGVGVEDCARVSRALEIPFDEKIHHSYELEVSSPGIERQLFTPEHFRRATGAFIHVSLKAPIAGAKTHTGRLVRVTDSLVLEANAQRLEIPLTCVTHAKVKSA